MSGDDKNTFSPKKTFLVKNPKLSTDTQQSIQYVQESVAVIWWLLFLESFHIWHRCIFDNFASLHLTLTYTVYPLAKPGFSLGLVCHKKSGGKRNILYYYGENDSTHIPEATCVGFIRRFGKRLPNCSLSCRDIYTLRCMAWQEFLAVTIRLRPENGNVSCRLHKLISFATTCGFPPTATLRLIWGQDNLSVSLRFVCLFLRDQTQKSRKEKKISQILNRQSVIVCFSENEQPCP